MERYEIDVAFEPEKHFLRATASVTLTATAPTEAIEFELNPRLQIADVTDAQKRALEFMRSGRIGSPKLLVRLAEPVAAGQGIALTFRYEGVLPPRPLDYITKDGILLRDESRWYPAVDLSAFAQHKISFKSLPNWVMYAPGYAGGDGIVDGLRWYSTMKSVSSRSVVAFPSKGMEVLPGCVDGCDPNVFVWIHLAHFDHAIDISRATDSLIRFYRGFVGQGASGMVGVLEGFPGETGAVGYAAPRLLVVSEDVVKHYDDPEFPAEFLPHEIAHQWFPIEVTLKSEEDGWLAESVAEYLAWRYLQENNPEAARRMVTRAMHDTMAYQPLRPLGLGLKLFAQEDWPVTHATLYSRGMLVWRTLETVIDRERVDRSLREYYARHRGGPAGIADFRKICEEISGRDLKWFFDYYIGGIELPRIELRRVAGAAPNEVAGEIIVRNVPAEFQVRVELRLLTAGGQVIRHSVATKGEVTPFTVTTPESVTQITLDPDSRILRDTRPAKGGSGLLPEDGVVE